MSNTQQFTSAATCLNQVPAAFKKIDWKPDTVNFDLGGGKFDKATEFLLAKGVTNLIYDPFNRPNDHNLRVIEQVSQGVDTVTVCNVLNIIDSTDARTRAIKLASESLKPEGTAYFSIYEGDKSGVGKKSRPDSWQNNRVTKSYIPELMKWFKHVTIKNKLIVAHNKEVP